MTARRPSGPSVAGSFLALALGACVTPHLQRVPGPIPLPEEPSAGAPIASSAPPITVQRSSDPVWIRHPGERGDILMPFYRKRERVPVGSLVRTGAGGRAELLWSPDASALALFDEGRVTVGDPDRDQPMLRFHSVTRALLTMTPEDRVELVGGALLAGDPLEVTGPILLERAPRAILRVTNQSKRVLTIAYRTERLELGPGESIDLPILESGAMPLAAPAPEHVDGPGFGLSLSGRAERRSSSTGLELEALEPTWVEALGVGVQLEPGQHARFSGLSQVSPAVPADPIAQP